MLSTDRRLIPTSEELKTTSEHQDFFYLTSPQTFTASPLLDGYSLLWEIFLSLSKQQDLRNLQEYSQGEGSRTASSLHDLIYCQLLRSSQLLALFLYSKILTGMFVFLLYFFLFYFFWMVFLVLFFFPMEVAGMKFLKNPQTSILFFLIT